MTITAKNQLIRRRSFLLTILLSIVCFGAVLPRGYAVTYRIQSLMRPGAGEVRLKCASMSGVNLYLWLPVGEEIEVELAGGYQELYHHSSGLGGGPVPVLASNWSNTNDVRRMQIVYDRDSNEFEVLMYQEPDEMAVFKTGMGAGAAVFGAVFVIMVTKRVFGSGSIAVVD